MILNLLNKLRTRVNGKVWGLRLHEYSQNPPIVHILEPKDDTLQYVNSTTIGTTDLPWAGMLDYNITSNGPSLVTESSEYSANNSNIYVKIPAFYFLCHATPENTYVDIYISDTDNSSAGFILHPGSNRYVSKYLLSNSGVSRGNGSYATDLVNTAYYASPRSYSELTALSSTQTNSFGTFYQLDFATYSAILLLFMFEYHSYYLDSCFTLSSTFGSPGINGITNSLTEHTGVKEGHTKYRNIEDFFNVRYSTPIIGIYQEKDAAYTLHFYDNPNLIPNSTTSTSNSTHNIQLLDNSEYNITSFFGGPSIEKPFGQWYWQFPYYKITSTSSSAPPIGYFGFFATTSSERGHFWHTYDPSSYSYHRLFHMTARNLDYSSNTATARGIYIPN